MEVINNFFQQNKDGLLQTYITERQKNNNEKIYILKNSKIKHLGSYYTKQDLSKNLEYLRNWHWMWSKFYYNKKYYGYLYSFFFLLPSFLSSIIKFFLNKIIGNQKKKTVYKMRLLGLINSYFLRKSFYRPYKK